MVKAQYTLAFALGLFLTTPPVQAQPMTIHGDGPVNAASYVPHGLPGGGVARGAIFILKGDRLCAPGFKKQESYPLPTSLSGTSVRVRVGGQDYDALMVYVFGGIVSDTGVMFDQIAAILPSTVPAGAGTLTVSYQGRSASTPILVLNSGPGIFTLSQSGRGPGVISDNVTFTVNTILNSFNENTWTNIWVTGLGPLPAGNPDNIAPPFGSLPVNMELYVGGQRVPAARILYFGRAPGNAGLDQILFQPPAGISGCNVSVYLKVGMFISNMVTMSLGPSLRCNDPVSASTAEMDRMAQGQPINKGRVFLNRADIKFEFTDPEDGASTLEAMLDLGVGRFAQYHPAYAPFSQEVAGLPSLGNCIVMTSSTDDPQGLDDLLFMTQDPVPHTQIYPANTLSLSNSVGERMMKGPRKLGTPTNVTVEYENSNVQPIHIFVKGMETFSPANRLDPDSDRTATIPFTNGQIVEFHAGRNGEVLAARSVKLSPRTGYINAVYDEDGVFSIGTAPAAPDGEILSFKNFLALLGGTVKDADGEDLDPPFLNPGNVRMQAGQGADIGPINTTTPVPNMSLDWLDKDVNRPINRSQGYLVRWSGGDPGREHVGIFGQSFLEGATGNFLTTGFICTAPVSANQFMIPADVLMRLAPTQQGGFSQLYVGTIPLNNAGRFSATGLESGHFGYTKSIIRSVTYQ